MKKFLQIFLFSFPIVSNAQDIDVLACKIVEIFNTKDSLSFLDLPIQPSDNKYIFMDRMKGVDVKVESESKSFQGDSAFVSFKKKIIFGFYELYNKGVRLGIDWTKVDCNEFKFEIQKNKESGFLNGWGNVFINSGKNVNKIILKGIIKINGKWRISHIDIE